MFFGILVLLFTAYKIYLFQNKYPPREEVIIEKGEAVEIMPGVKAKILETSFISKEDYFRLT